MDVALGRQQDIEKYIHVANDMWAKTWENMKKT